MNFDWSTLLSPSDTVNNSTAEVWFERIAQRLLNGSRLLVAGVEHRLTEIEFYFHGHDHCDPYTHCHPMQWQLGRWYFHRSRNSYRGGSFKGLDLTFGDGQAHGGILLRGIALENDRLVDGPCLLVDHFLAITGQHRVAALDQAIAGRLAWDADNPLKLLALNKWEPRPIYRSPRVGLTLNKARASTGQHQRFIMRHYRFLTEPKRIAKGKVLLALALHSQGRTLAEIVALTGCSAQSLARYLCYCEAGAKLTTHQFWYKPLNCESLCRLYGYSQVQRWG